MPIGPHVLYPTPEALAWAAQAPLVKILGGQPDLDPRRVYVAAENPTRTIVYRHVIDADKQQELLDNTASGPSKLRDMILFVLEDMSSSLDFPEKFFIESLNEISQRLGQGLERRCAFEQEFVRQMHSEGYKVIGFNFSAGGYEWDDCSYIASLDYCGVDVIGVHEYWRQTALLDDEWIFRYERFILENADANGKPRPKIFIGECGRGSEDIYKGWKSVGLTPQEYAREIKFYNDYVELNPEVIGITPFTSGANNGMWNDFDMDQINWRLL